jgi:ELWxxDGT repeat protein
MADRRLRQRRAGGRLQVELLEDRCLLASGLSAALVADINPGPESSYPRYLTNLDGTLYFSSSTPDNGQGELWKSDGTAAGTVFVEDEVGDLKEFTSLNGTVFFSSSHGLWKTDGTAAGTVHIHWGSVDEMTAVNGKLYFRGWTNELWVSDGTAAGTVLLKDIFPGTSTGKYCYKDPWFPRGQRICEEYVVDNSSDPGDLTDFNGTLFFAATDGANGRELWRSDGTAEGTLLVKDIKKGGGDSSPHSLTIAGGTLYFAAAGGLWRSDGTTAGTVRLKSVTASNLTDVNGTLYFVGDDGTNGRELWKSDGTVAGTIMVKDIRPGSADGFEATRPPELTNVNGKVYFAADDGVHGIELWQSNGTAAGTVLVKDVNPGSVRSFPLDLTNVNGRLYFSADDGVSGRELWQSDGTGAGTVMVRDIFPGNTSSDPEYFTVMNNKLYFAATDPEHGRELWDPPPVEPPAGSAGYLLVPDYVNHNVLRYDAATGAFVDEFVPRQSGGLNQPNGVVFGPHDGDLYITTGHFHGPGQIKAVLRFDGETGAFEDEFVERRQMDMSHSGIFGPDGHLYVSDTVDGNIGQKQGSRVLRFDGMTGTPMGEFVPIGSGGLKHAGALVFGPDATGDGQFDLYVTDEGPSRVMLYDGATGTFVREFVTGGSGGLFNAWGLTFGPDGNLYVASINTQSVMRYQGPSGPTPGAPLPAPGNTGAYFVSAGSGGLLGTLGVLFGPDGNADGHQDLYVTGADFHNQGFIHSKDGSVKRYDGVTGAFIDTFVAPGSGGLVSVALITFTETDPVTLAYTGGEALSAAVLPGVTTHETLTGIQRISVSDVTRSEGKNQTTLFTFTVTLSAAYDQPVTMSFRTVNATATSASDYVAQTSTLTFALGETTKTITIEVKGDSKKEANETFYLDLFDLSSNALFTRNRGLGTILNDD